MDWPTLANLKGRIFVPDTLSLPVGGVLLAVDGFVQNGKDGIGVERLGCFHTGQESITQLRPARALDKCLLEEIVDLFPAIAGSESQPQLL